jgi:3-hydroxybutyryl-CoA dehydrogenase
MEIKSMYVIGAGQMGAGIAQVAAINGYEVILRDITDELVKKGQAGIFKNLDKLVSKEKMTADAAAAVKGRIKTTVALEDAAQADLVIEAATENSAIKKQIFAQVDKIAKPGAILASNTSSISITELASATTRPQNFIGMHYFNPVPAMKLLEIIVGYSTSEETLNAAIAVGKKMEKIPVIAKDRAGFIVNRMLVPFLNEAVYVLEEGVGSKEDIDNGMLYGANHPMGPLALADLIGLDTILAIMEVLYHEYGDPKYRPAPLLRKMVRAGKLGRKVGEGFFKYQA